MSIGKTACCMVNYSALVQFQKNGVVSSVSRAMLSSLVGDLIGQWPIMYIHQSVSCFRQCFLLQEGIQGCSLRRVPHVSAHVMPCTHCQPRSRDISPLQRFLTHSLSHYSDQVITFQKTWQKELTPEVHEWVRFQGWCQDYHLSLSLVDGILGLKLSFTMLQEYTCTKAFIKLKKDKGWLLNTQLSW